MIVSYILDQQKTPFVLYFGLGGSNVYIVYLFLNTTAFPKNKIGKHENKSGTENITFTFGWGICREFPKGNLNIKQIILAVTYIVKIDIKWQYTDIV